MTRTITIVEQPNERGSALILVVLVLMMMSALTAALTVNGQTETLVSRNQRAGAQAQAAAEAGLNFHFTRSNWRPPTSSSGKPTGGQSAPKRRLTRCYLVRTGPAALRSPIWTTAAWPSGPEQALKLPKPFHWGHHSTSSPAALLHTKRSSWTTTPTPPDEDGNLLNDINETLIVRAIGYTRDGTTDETTKVVLEALIAPVQLGAIVTNGDLDISGSVTVDGTDGSVHSNGDLTISGGGSDITGTVTATGTYTGSPAGSGGAAPVPLPTISASDYLHYADFILTSSGTMTDQAGTVLCTWSGGTPCNNWDFDSGSGEWSIGSTAPPAGTYYVEGSVKISGSPGSEATPMQIAIIAEDSIDMSGSPDMIPDTPELLFVTDGDLEITGGLDIIDPLTTQGQMLVHEQVNLAGNPTLGGQLIVENAASVSPLVTGKHDQRQREHHLQRRSRYWRLHRSRVAGYSMSIRWWPLPVSKMSPRPGRNRENSRAPQSTKRQRIFPPQHLA